MALLKTINACQYEGRKERPGTRRPQKAEYLESLALLTKEKRGLL